jgi:hypothetical protein
MAAPQLWTFTQLGGPKTVLSLGGWSAPFGRPRKGEIVDGGLTIRNQRTDYAGTNLVPTIHTFGTMGKPFQLHGRWMDATIPATNGAQALAQQWKTFASAQVPVRAAWGNILGFQIFVHDLSLKYESQADVVWTLDAHVLVDEQAPVVATPVALPTPIDVATQMSAEVDDVYPFFSPAYAPMLGMLPGVAGGLSASFAIGFSASSSLSTAASLSASSSASYTGASGDVAPFDAVVSTCASNTDFDTMDSAELGSLSANLTTVQTSLLGIRANTDYAITQIAQLNVPDPSAASALSGSVLTADVVSDFATDKAASDASIANMLALIASMQQAIARVSRGQVAQGYQGQMGDTWESVGLRLMGSADGGRAIRDMNGIQYGTAPVPGRRYTIPQSG